MVPLAVLALAGCSDDLPDRGEVSGTISFQGKPLPGGTITFHPQGEGNPAYGELQSDGTYELTTYEKGDGAVLGEHIVTIEIFAGQAAPSALPGSETRSSSIPKKYTSVEDSPLKFTVESGSNTANFELKP